MEPLNNGHIEKEHFVHYREDPFDILTIYTQRSLVHQKVSLYPEVSFIRGSTVCVEKKL